MTEPTPPGNVLAYAQGGYDFRPPAAKRLAWVAMLGAIPVLAGNCWVVFGSLRTPPITVFTVLFVAEAIVSGALLRLLFTGGTALAKGDMAQGVRTSRTYVAIKLVLAVVFAVVMGMSIHSDAEVVGGDLTFALIVACVMLAISALHPVMMFLMLRFSALWHLA